MRLLLIDNKAAPAVRSMAVERRKPPDLAEQLRRAIVGCGMSLNQLAKATGVHRAQLSRFLRAERTLTLTAAAKICAHLGLYLTGPALQEKE
jgi:transcriptional regulator with XRE-family HTH domain